MAAFLVLAVFAALLLAEERGRAGGGTLPDVPRLLTNWGLAAINWLLLAVVPVAALVAAIAAPAGPLATLPTWLAAVPLLFARSLGTYGLHRLFHAVPLLWRVHAVHHADPAIDVSTGLRNHPIEALAGAAMAATSAATGTTARW
jgi:sterol desaturase/sphingolipid hydroxylase (fatty acid hydroxylase superfamily)